VWIRFRPIKFTYSRAYQKSTQLVHSRNVTVYGLTNKWISPVLPKTFCSRTPFGFEKQPMILTSYFTEILCPDGKYKN